MPTLVLSDGTAARISGGKLKITIPEEGTNKKEVFLPPNEVERILCSTKADIDIECLTSFVKLGVPTIFLSGSRGWVGSLEAPCGNAPLRLLQYKTCLDPAKALSISQEIVFAKIWNQRRILQKLGKNREGTPPEYEKLSNLLQKTMAAESTDTLRGFEGNASASYFLAYGKFYPERCPLEKRSRRPPLDPPNSVLSYAYSILTGEMSAKINASGLDACLGFLHTPEAKRPSLALDLIEPFRAPVADALAIDLFSHQTLHPDKHFEKKEGGVYMNKEGKKRLFVGYETRLEREFTSQKNGERTSLRREMDAQIQSLKNHLNNETQFEPFALP